MRIYTHWQKKYNEYFIACANNKRTGAAKVARNTFAYIVREDIPVHEQELWGPTTRDVIEIRLHGHPIVRIHPDGRVYGNDAGWQTYTTKDRLNYFGTVYQRNYQWYFSSPETNQTEPWQPGWNRIG